MIEPTTRNLGKYEILEEIGKGGFATVYRALDTTLKREVALKVLDPLLFRDNTFVKRFQQEAVTAANLDHPNIIPVYEVAEADGRHYIAMKLITGHTLADLVHNHGAMPTKAILSIVKDIAAALDYIHQRGLVHRDIKPSNILIDKSGRAMLSDFGLVRATEGSQLSSRGISIGTPSYMAPEQAEGQTVDARADLYALGVVVYEMATGQLPFSASSPHAILYQHVHKAPPAPSSANPAIAPAIDQVILRALEKNPEARYQTAQALCDDLVKAVAGRPLASPPPSKPKPESVAQARTQPVQPKPTQPATRHRGTSSTTVIGCLAIFVCVLAAGVGFLAWRNGWPPFGGSASATPVDISGVTATSALSPTQFTPSPTLSPTASATPAQEPTPTRTLEPTAIPSPVPEPTLADTPAPTPIPSPEPTATPLSEEGMIVRTWSNEQGDTEPNDTFLDARRIHFGEQVAGLIDPRGDWDHYYFYGEQGAKITIDVEAATEGSKLDSYISIWNADGDYIGYSNNDGYTADSRITDLALPADGIYLIRIEQYENNIGGANYFYKLSLQPSGMSEPAEIPSIYLIPEVENNDVIPAAMHIGFGDRVLGTIGQAGDWDYFSFDGYGGTEVVADINASIDGSALDSWVSIWTVDGQFIGYNNGDGHTPDSQLSLRLPEDGRYFLRIEQYENGAGGQDYFYALSLTASDNSPGPTPTPIAYGQETEPNDGLSTATQLAIGSTVKGTIGQVGDLDYFRIEGLAGDLILLDTNAFVDGSPLDSYLSIWNSEGQQLGYNNDDIHTIDSRIQDFRFPADGTYYIRVQEYEDDQGGAEYFYTLRVLPVE